MAVIEKLVETMTQINSELDVAIGAARLSRPEWMGVKKQQIEQTLAVLESVQGKITQQKMRLDQAFFHS